MNTYCDDCKRCTGGCMVKSEVEGDDHNRCSECEAKLQDENAALRARVEKLETALENIRKHWLYAGGALAEYSPITKMCNAALAECEEMERG